MFRLLQKVIGFIFGVTNLDPVFDLLLVSHCYSAREGHTRPMLLNVHHTANAL